MPYNYVHLISSVTTLYLMAYAFHQGLGFLPTGALARRGCAAWISSVLIVGAPHLRHHRA